jgi:hypothetical protein
VKDASRFLLIERGNRFGANDLAASSVHGGKGNIGIDHAECSLDHLAAVVYLGDDAVCFVLAVERNREFRPVCRSVMS